MRRLACMAVVLLIAAAGVLVLSRLRLPEGTVSFRMEAPRAQLRHEKHIAMPQTGGSVDVNHASPEALDTLPGVGPVIAQRIIDEREQNGPFHYPEDLLAVDGIGEKTLEKLRDQIHLP